MANTNVLSGIACPRCGQEDDFRITATTAFDVTDDGTGDIQGDIEWEDDSLIMCLACKHGGTVAEFNTIAKRYREAAREAYAIEGQIEIDDNAIVSHQEDHRPAEAADELPDGSYVAAWVWVAAEDIES